MIPSSVDSPAVWRGDELLRRPDWLQRLSEADVAELTEATDAVRDRPLDEITREAFALPKLATRLLSIQHSLEHSSGATMLRGLPVDEFDEEQLVRMFLGIALHLGTPVSQSATGERIFHVRDEGYRLDDPRARGPNTRKRLSFHTDRCDVIAFMCLKQARIGGDNDVVSSAALYNEIRERRPDLLDVLLKPYYYKRHNVDQGNQQAYCRQPVFSFCDGFFAACFLRVLIDRAHAEPDLPDLTPHQVEALDFLEAVAEETELRVRFRQEPGDILLLNNWVTFHRRTEFEDHEDPSQRRHILRAWLSVPNSRPIDPLFRDNYGATEAGAVRGGMRQRGE